jgi:tRNA A-37 threonylcarbamoyl transferase component Bud32
MKEHPRSEDVTMEGLPDSRERIDSSATLAAPPVSGRESGAGAVSSRHLLGWVGHTIDNRYVVEQLLGEGGMGVVFLARHKVIDKRVAIKVLRSEMASDVEMTERFLNEARSASSIGNPHIVDISDFGQLPDGSTYFVMEFLDGQRLADLTAAHRQGGVPTPRLVHVAKQIARGLSAAHAVGIVHRDLKPDNVMLVNRGEDRDFVKVLDFGIAKVDTASGRLTKAGSVFGTPHYMAPEQAAGLPVDNRTDIYSLGVILYEMASGKVPFDADNFMGILTQHMYKKPALIRAIVPQPQEVPPGLEAVVMKCLEKKADLRYRTMDEVIRDLEKVEQGLVPDALPELMARSGGFHVPVDYFRTAGRSPPGALVPGTPPAGPRRGPSVFVMGLLATCTTALVVIAGVVAYSRAPASTKTPTSTTSIAGDPGAPPAHGSAPAVTAAPAKVTVTVRPTPPDAVLSLVEAGSETDLGLGNRVVEVVPGHPVTVRATREGYVGRTVDVDGSQPNVPLKLESAPVAAKAPGAKALPTNPEASASSTKPPAQPVMRAAPAATPTRKCPVTQQYDPILKDCL